MNEEYIKEYEKMSFYDLADELVEPLFTVTKDLPKTIYIHYAEERDKNEQLQQENARLKETLEKITNYIKEHDYDYIYLDCKFLETKIYNDLLQMLDKLKEN